MLCQVPIQSSYQFILNCTVEQNPTDQLCRRARLCEAHQVVCTFLFFLTAAVIQLYGHLSQV